jgi:hypothetical protein
MALGGLAPLIIFTFYKTIKTPSLLSGLTSESEIRVPLVPIPLYLEERITGLLLDDYDRDISIDVLRDGVSAFERVSGDVVNLKFRMQKDNLILTVLTSLIDRIIKTFDEQVASKFSDRNYTLTIFYDNIFILDASLERFNTRLVEGTDLREVTFTFSKRAVKETTTGNLPIGREVGTSGGII